MEKLELKHLAPYLPYGLRISKIHFLNSGKGIGSVDHLLTTKSKQYKPILRPIEDLYIPETDCGIKIVHYFNFKTNVKLDCRNFPYHVMEQLFKNHFDVFGLIDKGLANSYSDVQSTSNEG